MQLADALCPGGLLLLFLYVCSIPGSPEVSCVFHDEGQSFAVFKGSPAPVLSAARGARSGSAFAGMPPPLQERGGAQQNDKQNECKMYQKCGGNKMQQNDATNDCC